MRLLLLVRSLDVGGAEVQLAQLATGLASRGHTVRVATLYEGGALRDVIAADGIECPSLGKRSRWDVLGPARQLAELARSFAPDVVYSFMPAANILAGALRHRLQGARVVWGIRASDMDLHFYGAFTRLLPRAEVVLSRRADLIISNSESARLHYIREGCDERRVRVIPNGIDTHAFAPDAAGRQKVRAEFQVSPGTAVIGLIGRIDPVKGHDTFLRIAALVRRHRSDVQFWSVGSGNCGYAAELTRQAQQLGVADVTRWLGQRADMRAIYNALDVTCLTSRSESFPNVIAESMACGTPAVALDVGDARSIVGDSALIVRPGSDEAFAATIVRTLEQRQVLQSRVRDHIANEFGLVRCIENTESCLASLIAA